MSEGILSKSSKNFIDRGHILTEKSNPKSAQLDRLSTKELVKSSTGCKCVTKLELIAKLALTVLLELIA